MTTPERDEATESHDETTGQSGAGGADQETATRGATGSAEQVAEGEDLPYPAGGTVDESEIDGGAESDEEPLAADAIAELSRDELVAALHETTQERDEYLEALRRNQAEFQNYRRRTMREGSAQRDKGVADVLSGLVDVVDEFELAVLASESADPQNLRKGVEMVYGKFIDVLRSFGLEKIGQEGATFDPEMHDAVQQIESEEEQSEPVVAEVLRPGYSVGDRVLRPAMVKVRR